MDSGYPPSQASGYPPSLSSGSVSSGPVQCDVCNEHAVKRCLTCMASYCEVHVRDHLRELDNHELQDLHHHSLCPQHHKKLEFYCRTDQSAICSRCFLHDHNGHNVIEQTPERTSSEDVPPPGPIQFVSVQPDSVSLRWSPPEGAPGHRTFKVTWTGGQKHCNLTVIGTSIDVTELTPGEKYHFTVATLSQDGRQSTPVEGAVYTEVPPPHDLQVNVDLTSLKASVTWTKPAGVDRVTYLLEIIKDGGQEDKRTIQRESCQYTLTGLQTREFYTINITTVVNNGRQSQPGSTAFKTDPPLRIVLIGKVGVGKSATGNTILGREAFDSRSGALAVTLTCQRASTRSPREILLVDTPGVLHTHRADTEVEEEILKSIQLSAPGPHAFLLVIQVGRFTREEQNAVRALLEMFGERAADHMIVLFTCADKLEDKTIEEYVQHLHPKLQELIRSCGGRYHAFNNMSRDRTQVVELVRRIDEMVAANGGQHFTV